MKSELTVPRPARPVAGPAECEPQRRCAPGCWRPTHDLAPAALQSPPVGAAARQSQRVAGAGRAGVGGGAGSRGDLPRGDPAWRWRAAILGWTLFAEAALQGGGLQDLGEQPLGSASSATCRCGGITCNWPALRSWSIPVPGRHRLGAPLPSLSGAVALVGPRTLPTCPSLSSDGLPSNKELA